MYCGAIYDNDWGEKLLNAKKGGLGREYNNYTISTGVGPCCMDKYRQEMAALEDIIIEPYQKNNKR